MGGFWHVKIMSLLMMLCRNARCRRAGELYRAEERAVPVEVVLFRDICRTRDGLF